MAGVRDAHIYRAGPWPLGIDNVSPEGALPVNEFGTRPTALRDAVNTDLSTLGHPRRRAGYTAATPGTLMHSLWAHDDCPFGLVVDDGVLHAVDNAGGVQSLGTAVGGAPLSYELIAGRVYFSNRSTSGLVDADLQVHDWAPEHPPGQPDVAASSGLALPEGQYQVAVTFVDALGRESGTGLAAAVEVAADGAVELTNIPQPLAAIAVNIYLTGPNDQVLRLHSTLAPGITAATLGHQADGRALGTQFLSAMPAGQHTCLFNGRHVVAEGRYLRWSPPMRYGMTDRARHVMPFPARIDLVVPAGGGGRSPGLYVASGNRTYWLAGDDPEAWSLQICRSAGAVPGVCLVPSAATMSESAGDQPVWLARDGQFVVGDAYGNVRAFRDGTAAVPDADRAAMLYRERDGLNQVVAGLRGARPQAMAVSDRATAHVIHNEVAMP